jgi:hypothetical protein
MISFGQISLLHSFCLDSLMPVDSDPVSPEPRPKLWLNALFFIGSAAFGGLAVVLWNRRELAQIQKESSRQVSPPTSGNDSDEEII